MNDVGRNMYYGFLYDTDIVKDEILILTRNRIIKFKGGSQEVTDRIREGKIHIGSEVMIDAEASQN